MAEIHHILRILAVHAAVHHEAQLVCDLLRYNEPIQFGMQGPRQATVKLLCTADYSSCGIQHSLQQLVRPYCPLGQHCSSRDNSTSVSILFVHEFPRVGSG